MAHRHLLSEWLLWTGANATTAMYATTNLNDVWVAL